MEAVRCFACDRVEAGFGSQRPRDQQRLADVFVTVLLWVLATLVMLIGLIGVVVPALPGTILVLAGLLLSAWADGSTRVSIWTVVGLGVIAAASYGVDFAAAALGAKHLGASRPAARQSD